LAESAPGSAGPDASALDAGLRESLEGIFTTMLAREVSPPDASAGDRAAAAARWCVARIELHGDRDGVVSLRCDPGAARALAIALLMMDEADTLADEEVLDAVGECANMLAGGLKTRVFDPLGYWIIGTPACAVEAALPDSKAHHAVDCGLGGGLLTVDLSWAAETRTAAVH